MASPVKDARNKHIADGFTEVFKRTKGGIESRMPGTDRRAMTVTVGNRGYHFGDGPYDESHEIDTAWVASGGAWDWECTKNDFESYVRDSVPVSYRYVDKATQHYVELTINAIEWTNDEDQSESAAIFQQVTPTINDDEIKWSGIATGWDVRILSQVGRLAKWIDIDSLSPPTIGGTNIRLRFRLTWQKSNGLQVWANGEQWAEKNNTWADTSGAIEFRDEISGETIYTFAQPFGHDDTLDNEAVMSQRVRRLGANFYSEIFTPWSWLQTAQYPVHLDTTIDVFTAASDQDATETPSGTVAVTGGTPTLDYTNVLYFGYYFVPTSSIASGDTIDTSYLAIFCINKDDPDETIWAEKADTPSVFSVTGNPNYDISSRTPTTATVSWIATGLGNNARHNSPSLNTVITELKNAGYLDDTESIVIVENANDTDSNWRASHYDQGSNYPELYIAFTPASGATLTVADMAHAHNLDAAGTLIQVHNIITNDMFHAHNLDAASPLVQIHNLIVNDMFHAHNLASLGLIYGPELVVNDMFHAHNLDAVALSQVHNVIVNDMFHAHSLDPTGALVQFHNLVVADMFHAHNLDALNVVYHSTLQNVADMFHDHWLAGAVLGQVHLLTVADMFHANTLDAVLLGQIHNLVVSDMFHANTLDGVILKLPGDLTVADLFHAHSLESVVLSQVHNLTLEDMFHEHWLDGVSFPGAGGDRRWRLFRQRLVMRRLSL